MGVWMLAAALLTLAAVAFVLAPLFRAEEDLEPLVRSRSGIRRLAGPESGEPTGSVRGAAATEGRRRCPHCGEPVGSDYVFCGTCGKPLPT